MTGIVIPSLGGSHLQDCLAAVSRLNPAPSATVVVLSGGAPAPEVADGIEIVGFGRRLGFAAAVNAGFDRLPGTVRFAAVLNDDAAPAPSWLGVLARALGR